MDSRLQRQGLGEAISFTTHRNRCILVDAGQPGSALYEKLLQPVDVLLLTHNDRDHVGGVRELLRSGLVTGEVWVPYDWYLLYSTGADLVDALRRRDDDLANVAREALERVTSEVELLRRYLEDVERLDEPDSLPLGRSGALGELNTVWASLNSGMGSEVVLRAQHAIGDRWIGDAKLTAQGVTSGGTPTRRARATVSVVDAVLEWGGPPRWFSIDHASASPRTAVLPWELSGLAGEFTVVNGWQVPVLPLPPPPTAAVAYARLAVFYQITIQNRRALVALGHAQSERGHVLFTSDSAFEFDQLTYPVVPWPRIGAAVGLHHGSAGSSHDYIYERFGGTVLARSGSRHALRTNSRFTRVLPQRRGCTWCHADDSATGGLDRHRDVTLEVSQFGDWRVVAGACTDCPRFA